MSQQPKDTGEREPDINQDGMIQPPPPSYASTTAASSVPPSGAQGNVPPASAQGNYYQAYPAPGSNPPFQQQQFQQPFQQQQTYGSPPPGVYVPSPAVYSPAQGGGFPPQGGNTVVYVVDDDTPRQDLGHGIPIAMVCFIFGLCTWVGYLFGMCFIGSKDPRERWWARMCMIMCLVWSLIIIFASIFGRP